MDLRPHTTLDARVKAGWAVLSGVVFGLSYHPSPIGSWPLGLVSMIPLLLVLRGVGVARALWLGWLCGFSASAVGFSWLPSALASFGSLSSATAAAAAVPFWIYNGGRVAVFAACAVRSARNGWHPWLGIIAAFAASEVLYPVVAPWYLAGGVHDAPILLQVGDLGGPILIGLVVLVASLLVSELMYRSTAPREPSIRTMALAGVFLAGALAYGGFCLGGPFASRAPAGRGMRVTVGMIQGNADPLDKVRDPAGTLRRQLLLSKRLLAQKPVDVLVWSETSTGYSVDQGLLERWVKEVIAPHLSVPMILGTGVIGEGGSVYNAAISTLANGDVAGRYEKQRLFPIGEYPLAPKLLPGLASKAVNFREGREAGALPMLGHPIATTICYEGLWPGIVRHAVRAHDAELIVNLTNDVRFGDTAEPYAHFLLTKLRAVEQRRYLVRATNSGISAIVDPAGRVTVATGLFQEETVSEDVFLMSGRTLYSLVGDAPWYALSALCLFMILVRRWQLEHGESVSPATPPTPDANA
jgi:apolipoprotein N-acyltransferase